jgi:hypothetical protein
LRYREVLDNLAMVAENPFALPAYSSIFSGSASVTDTAQLGSTTIWQHVIGKGAPNGFASEAANGQLSRTVVENWTLDSILIPEKLEAIRAACRYLIYRQLDAYDQDLLICPPDAVEVPLRRHFGVLKRLQPLAEGNWLHCGTLHDASLGAAYVSHYRGTWVWVMPEDVGSLSVFTLILQDIARVNGNNLTLFASPPPVSAFSFYSKTSGGFDVIATVGLSLDKELSPDTPYFPWRTENLGTDAKLRSQINVAGSH